MLKQTRFIFLALGLILAAGSASAMWWITDMFDQPAKKPQSGTPLQLPAGAIPVHGGAYPSDLPRAELAAMLPANPYAGQAYTPQGKQLYDVYCGVCHGATGAGDGPVAVIGKGIPQWPLATAAGFSDQMIFAQIWVANNMFMGPYYWALTPDETWQVVNYVRSLIKP